MRLLDLPVPPDPLSLYLLLLVHPQARARAADPARETAPAAGPDPLGAFIMFASFVKILFGGCPGGRHYYVNQGGTWTCSMCGATQ